MAIVQDVFDIPDDIATGLATGLYRRIGGVVRYAIGSKKGQIVKHLKPIELDKTQQAKNGAMQVFEIVKQHKTGAAVVVLTTTLIGAGVLAYKKIRNAEPKELTHFRISLKKYIDAIRQGNMNIDTISDLMKALENLKKCKDYEKITIQLTSEELDVLVSKIHEYTVKLAFDNNIDISNEELSIDGGAIVNLQRYLETQKRIINEAA